VIKDFLWLIPILPLAGAAINGLLGYRLPARGIHSIACGSILLAFVVSALGFLSLVSIPEGEERVLILNVYQWISTAWTTGGLSLSVAFRLDPLSSVLCLVVTGVGFLIHLYSVGYMAGDESQARYFAYLNLFTFAMLLLVTGDNLLLMFVGWEGVGLCSYLLIGFWFTDQEKARAGMKAFIVNRVGDFGFLVGLMLLFWTMVQTGGVSAAGLGYDHLRLSVPLLLKAEPILGLSPITWVALLFFVGATGKSAQIPLYVWLPDAMAGPTPVSAFIHAATMVTAGVYMIARLNFIYAAAPVALSVVALVGALTAVFAAVIALAQDDIKKVLAYSTISQLGYMFLGVGLAAFGAGIFHLVTHAFFKALLFLGAGSVIHAVHHNDVRLMGGLKKYMPATFVTFLLAYLAICGVPPFAGFMSKDEIILAAFTAHLPVPGLAPLLGVLALIGAGLTAFYMTRLVVLTFAGDFRGSAEEKHHLHESPLVMTGPLMVLAGLSAVGGFIGLPGLTGLPNLIHHFLSPVFASGHGAAAAAHGHGPEGPLMAVSTAVAVGGILLGWLFYMKKPDIPGAIVARLAGLHRVVLNKFYVDEAYAALFVRPMVRLANLCGVFDNKAIDGPINFSAKATTLFSFLIGWEDLKVVDGLVNGLADLVKRWGAALQGLQTGRIQDYLYSVVLGLFGLYLINLLF